MGRVVTGIEEVDKKRSRIILEQDEAFVLYKGEVAQYKIHVNEEMPDAIYNTIQTEILPKRAKKRSLNLLRVRPYTEQKLKEKLREGFYSESIIEETIDYVKSFHYIDDYEYACQYIFYHKEAESKKKMEEKLRQKGIGQDILEQAFEDSYDSEEEQLEIEFVQAKKYLEKKKYDQEHMEWKEKQRIYAFLVRKGIRTSVIRKSMSLQEYE